MKLKIVFILLLFRASLSFSQVFTLNELIKLTTMNMDDADTFISSKKYSFSKSENTEKHSSRTYSFNKNFDGNAQYWLVFYSKYFYTKKSVSWQTNKNEDYVNFKKQLKLNGFTYIDSKTNNDGSVSFKYTKGKYEVEIFTAEVQGSEKIINQYEIDVTLN